MYDNYEEDHYYYYYSMQYAATTFTLLLLLFILVATGTSGGNITYALGSRSRLRSANHSLFMSLITCTQQLSAYRVFISSENFGT